MSSPVVTIITPCYNENQVAIRFLEQLEGVLSNLKDEFRVVVVDDCSDDNTLGLLRQFQFHSKNISLKILKLKFNVGHQAAIYQGILFSSTLEGEHFIVMDSDGEDAPSAIPKLLALQGFDIVHAVRGKRQESFSFRFSYAIYKMIFRFVTGKQMNYGNYCFVNRKIIESAAHHGFSHFAAFLSKQKCTRGSVVVEREKRLDGKSKMSYKSLLSHAFRSFVEYGEDLLLLFLKMFGVIMILFVLAITNVIYQKFVADTAILGWTSVVAIGLLNMAIISIGFFVLGILLLNLSKQKDQNSKQAVYEEIS